MLDTPEILSRAGIFQGVDTEAVNTLISQLDTMTFSRGTTIFEEGEPGDRLFIIIQGKVKLARHSIDGRENLLTVMGPSDTVSYTHLTLPTNREV